MNKKEWLEHYRSVRSERPKTSLSSEVIISALKSLYTYDYTDAEAVFVHLFEKYKHRLPTAEIKIREEKLKYIQVLAAARMQEHFRNLVYRNNPFLALLPKATEFNGTYIPVTYESDREE